MQTPDKLNDGQLSDEQSREVAETIREEIARRRISRQALAEQAKLSLSTLEKALGGRRPFTLATTVRLEQALGVSLRKSSPVAPSPPAGNDVAPDSLGSYSHRAVTWIEDVYITLRPSFGDKDAIFAYRTEIVWEPRVSSLVFREGERTDAAYEHTGEVAVPHQSGFIYLVINKHGQHRVITVSRPTVNGEMYGIISSLRAGPGSQLTPIAAPIAYVPLKNVREPTLGRIAPDNPNHALYRSHLRRTVEEPFALFLPG
ncbi:helix-turn-helix domain-containing protein [Bradyrhizobium cytisi]|uniref:Helix-turn-helix transcriptional regulator n=1 Tax=Bradyrhizobium cytisi TaxID=515489 RepID=A0A5S4WVG3_9BRAD|nr:helix-turn-helix transcriptional regulator [Bradyrhizobium cytisi]TYL85331.1 helix-turn-helix transcriptional regulator [Bradyrhizobium cytisi]